MARRDDFPSWSRVFRAVLCLTLLYSGVSQRASAQSANLSQGVSVVASAGHSPFVVAPAVSVAGSPTSAAVGDLNGDGKLDLVITKSGSNNVTVLLGTGDGHFATGTDFAAGTQPSSVQIGDLNGDGRPDIVVSNQSTGTINVLLGKGDGTFAKPVQYSAVADAVSVTIGDFSGNGKIDLAVAGASSQTIAVLRNDEAGHFSKATPYVIGKQAQALAVADLNGDGHSDIVSANSDGTVSVLLGGGNGVFRSGTSSSAGSGALSGIVTGDFNGDGKADVAVTESSSNQLIVLLGRGDGSFQPGVSYTVGNDPAALAAADVNGDGVTDLVTVNEAGNTFSVLIGNGDGTFKPALDFTAGNSPRALAAGDFNGDGHVDLAILNYLDGTVSVPLGKGDGTFGAARAYRTDLERKAIAVGDLNGDGKPDLVVTNFCGSDSTCKSNGTATVFLAQSNGSYAAASSYSLGNGPVAVALADLNGDGKLDLVALNRTDKSYTVMLGNGDGTFGEALTYPLGKSPLALVAGDFNKDGKPDLAISSDCGSGSCTQPGEVDILLGRGDGSFAAANTYTVGYAPSSLAAGDLNGDGIPDLAVANACGEDSSCKSPGTATLLTGNGKGAFTQTGEIKIGGSPSSIAIGSLSGSGVDLIAASSTGNAVAVLHSDGKGGFGTPATYAVGSAPSSVAVADFNGDGKPDVAVANFAASTVSVLFGNGDGTLQPASTYSVGTGPESLVALSPTKTAAASLVSANGNSGATPMGTDITVLANVQADATIPSSTALTASPTTSVVSQPVTLTAVVTGNGSTPTGSVTFMGGTTSLSDCNGGTSSSVNLDGTGTAVCVTELIPLGNDTVTASYGGDSTYSMSNGTTPVTVDPGSTNTTVSSSTGGTSTVNGMVTFTSTTTVVAPGTGAIALSGTVTFTDSLNSFTCMNVPVNTSNGTATCTVSTLSAGTHTVTATYGSDLNYNGGAGTVGQTVNKAPTTGMLTSSINPSTVNQSVTFTLAVTTTGTQSVAFSSAPTITFKDGANPISCTVAWNPATGTATCATSALTAVSHSITATYSGDPNYSDSTSNTVTQVVNKLTPTISVSGAQQPSTYGMLVTFTAIVTGQTGFTQPTGTVTFMDGANPVACTNSGTLTQGSTHSTATCNVATLTGGTHSITATYVPGTDPNYNAVGPSTATMQLVNRTTPTIALTLTSGSPSSPYGATLVFTSTVAGPSVTGIAAPTGNVLLNDSVSGTTICTSPLVAGSATCTVSTLSVSLTTHQITATYAVAPTDPNYLAAGPSTAVPVTINKATPSISVTNLGGANSSYGSPVTFTATVANTSTASGLTEPTGTVTFKDGATMLTCSNANGGMLTPGVGNSIATCTTSSLSAGSHSITATYAPAVTDPNYMAAGPSTAFMQMVSQLMPTISVTGAPNASTYGSAVTFTATVTGASGQPQPTGSVTFSDGATALTCTNSGSGVLTAGTSNSTATCVIATLTGGTHQITASYAPATGSNYSAAGPSTAFPQSVNKFTPAVAVVNAMNPTSSYGVPVTFTATVTGVTTTGTVQPTGMVTFNDGTTILTCSNAGAGVLAQGTTSSTATCTISTLMGGTHQITATYVPGTDPNYNPFGPSTPFMQVVNAGSTTTAITSVPPASSVNQSVTFTTVVTPVIAGATKPQGTVTLTDGLTNATLCTVTLNPDGTVPPCTATFVLAGTHTITAAYASSNGDFSGSSGTDSQVVQATGTMTTVTSSPPTSMVNQAVTFTAVVTADITGPATGAAIPQGTVAFTDGLTNATLCTVTLTAAGAVPPCPTTLYVSGTHTITATFTPSNNNFSGSAGTDSQVVSATPTTTVVVSSMPTSVATKSVTFTATVTPTFIGKTSPTGSVLFSLSGDQIDSCVAVPVSLPANATAPYTATCTIAFSSRVITGSVKVTATYVGDGNFVTSSGSVTQTVQNFTLALPPAGTVTVTQGFTNATDPVLPQAVNVTAASISGFATAQGMPLNLTCTFTPLAAPAGATMPVCPMTQLAVSASAGAQTAAPITIDAKSATPGSYLLVVTGTDPTTGLAQMTTLSYIVNVSFFTTSPLNVASGSTTDTTFNFTLPAGVEIPINCNYAIITPSTIPVPTSTIPIVCSLSSTTIGTTTSTSPQSIPLTVTVNTGGAMTQLSMQTNVYFAGLLGIPVLALIGFVSRGKRPSRTFFRFLGAIFILATILQSIGCGGSFNRTTTQTNTTPAGVYYLLVQGPGTTNAKQPYQAVIQVNVIR